MICAVALETLATIEDEKLLDNVRARGEQLRAGLEKLKSKHELIKEIRGEGCMLGVELSLDGGALVSEALQRGLLVNCTQQYTIRLLPPFLISPTQVREFLHLFEKVLSEAARAVPAAETFPSETSSPAAKSAASVSR